MIAKDHPTEGIFPDNPHSRSVYRIVLQTRYLVIRVHCAIQGGRSALEYSETYENPDRDCYP